jgi:hypothetical protein
VLSRVPGTKQMWYWPSCKAVVGWLDRWVEVGSGSGESPAQLPSLRRPRRMTSQGEVVLVCQHMSLSRQRADRCACSCCWCIFWILDSGCELPPSTAVARSWPPSVPTSTLLLSRGRQGCRLTTRARTGRQRSTVDGRRSTANGQRCTIHDPRCAWCVAGPCLGLATLPLPRRTGPLKRRLRISQVPASSSVDQSAADHRPASVAPDRMLAPRNRHADGHCRHPSLQPRLPSRPLR